jgi:pyruvate formate lyase activating enzyme
LIKLDTNGSNPRLLESLLDAGEIDFVSMDVKAPLDPFSYRRSTGVSVDLNLIRKSIEVLKGGKVEYEFRMTVVPGLHREEDVRSLGDQLRAGQRFMLQSFNPEDPLDPALKDTVPYEPKVLKALEGTLQKMT